MEEIRDKLIAEKENLEKQLVAYKIEDPLLGPDKDPAATSEDVLTGAEGHERITATRLELKKRLLDVEAAIKRVNEGNYGVCGNCGREISKERMAALPTARFCLECGSRIGN